MFNAEIRHEGRANVIYVSGEFSFDIVDRLQAAVDELKMKNQDPIVMDLSQVDFIDSKGAAFLIGMKQSFNGREVVLAGVPKNVHNVLLRLSVAERFRMFGTAEDALRRI